MLWLTFPLHLSFSKATQSVGLLSYTFLRRTGQDDVIVPMVLFGPLTSSFSFPPWDFAVKSVYTINTSVLFVLQIDFDISGNWVEPITYGSQDDWTSNLKTILEWSPFASKEDLMLQVIWFESSYRNIIIYLSLLT